MLTYVARSAFLSDTLQWLALLLWHIGSCAGCGLFVGLTRHFGHDVGHSGAVGGHLTGRFAKVAGPDALPQCLVVEAEGSCWILRGAFWVVDVLLLFGRRTRLHY
jgi:hypothetical protein